MFFFLFSPFSLPPCKGFMARCLLIMVLLLLPPQFLQRGFRDPRNCLSRAALLSSSPAWLTFIPTLLAQWVYLYVSLPWGTSRHLCVPDPLSYLCLQTLSAQRLRVVLKLLTRKLLAPPFILLLSPYLSFLCSTCSSSYSSPSSTSSFCPFSCPHHFLLIHILLLLLFFFRLLSRHNTTSIRRCFVVVFFVEVLHMRPLLIGTRLRHPGLIWFSLLWFVLVWVQKIRLALGCDRIGVCSDFVWLGWVGVGLVLVGFGWFG